MRSREGAETTEEANMTSKRTMLVYGTIALCLGIPAIASAQSFTARKLAERIYVVGSSEGGEGQLVIVSAKGLVVFDSFWSRITAQKYKDGITAALGRDDFYLTVNTVDRLDMFGGNAAYENTIVGHSSILGKYRGMEKEVDAEIRRLIGMWRWKEEAAKERLKTHAPGSREEAVDRSWAATCKQRADELEAGFSLVLPTEVYSDRVVLDLGDVTLELVWFGRAGYDGMTVAVIPEEEIAIIPGFILHSHHLAPHPNSTYVKLDVPRWTEVLGEVLEGDNACKTIICDVNTIWSRERALTHLEYIRRLWDATIEGERAGQSLDEAEERLSLDNDFAFVKNMQVYKERGDDWVRPQHQSHVRVFFLQHKNMACDVLRKGLETSPETAVADIRSQRDRGSNIYFDEASMNGLGYELLTASRNAEAIEVFRLNAEVFPGSANAQDGLAEAYMKTGKRDKAIEHYKRSLELNSENENARDKLMELEEE